MTTTGPLYFLEWTLSHERYPEVTLSATSSVKAVEALAERGLVTVAYHADGSVHPTITDRGRSFAHDAFGDEGYTWLTEHCACAKPHRL